MVLQIYILALLELLSNSEQEIVIIFGLICLSKKIICPKI